MKTPLTDQQKEDLFDDYARENEMFHRQTAADNFERYQPSEHEYQEELQKFFKEYHPEE